MKPAVLRAVLLLVGLHVALAWGACAAGPDRKPDSRSIRGVVRIVGNEPFTQVVVSSPSDAAGVTGRIDYLIEGPLAKELRACCQGRTVVLEGTEVRPSRPRFRHGFAPSRIVGVE